MAKVSAEELSLRRRIEDELIALGNEREKLEYADSWNRERIRGLLGPAREAGITTRDVAHMTGLSSQTLHTWKRDLMRPIPEIHLGQAGPAPQSLDQSVLRTMGEDPERDWNSAEIRRRIIEGWPTGSPEEISVTLERLARGHLIWDVADGYRVAPPTSGD